MPDFFKLRHHAKHSCPGAAAPCMLFSCRSALPSRLHHHHHQHHHHHRQRRRFRLVAVAVAVAIQVILFCGSSYVCAFTTTTTTSTCTLKTAAFTCRTGTNMFPQCFLNTRVRVRVQVQPTSLFVRNSMRRSIARSSSSSALLCGMSPSAPAPDKRAAARAKRKRKIGLAKAVDRAGESQYRHTYQPGPPFRARTGLPSSFAGGSSQPHYFTVLGIETSCDDTGAAVVRSDGALLGEALASQAELHEPWGGIVPGLAMRAHQQAVDRVVQQALRRANATMHDVDAVAVTVGPGLEVCLRVGVQAAVRLSQDHGKPFVGVHHLEAHILMARLPPQQHDGNDNNQTIIQPNHRAIEFPFLALLVSGGHCQLLRCHGIGRYEILGGTLDDSLGEAFDKTARLLGLPVGGGGGPAVERLARRGDPAAVPLTVPMRHRRDCDFSYAGLKTNVRRAAEELVRQHNSELPQQQQQQRSDADNDNDNDNYQNRAIETPDQLPESVKADLAASFQNVAIAHIEDRLKRAMEMVSNGDSNENSKINTLALVGGVAANQELRSRLETVCRDRDWTMVVPPPRLCTDQGAMSAWAGVERLLVGSSDDRSTDVYARYPFASLERVQNSNVEN